MNALAAWLPWLMLVGVVVVYGALVYIAWWALFADRGRGRRRCPRCWYDLAYSPGMICGECGFSAVGESQFGKTRRRYRLAAAAIVISVIIAAAINDRLSQRGLPSMLPTEVLLWMLPWSGNSNSILTEIANRANAGRLSDRQWSSLIERCAIGDWRARPTNDAWVDKYGVFIRSWRGRLGSNPGLASPLLKLPPRVDATTRPTWPSNVPVVVAVQVRDWWPVGMECRIRATLHQSSNEKIAAGPITFYRSGDDRFQRPAYSLHLPPLDPSVNEMAIDFEVDRRPARGEASLSAGENSEWTPVARQTIRLATQAEGELDQAAQPVDDEELTAVMKRVFSEGAVKWTGGRSPVRFRVGSPATAVSQFNDTAVGVSAELLCDGVLARRLDLWWIAGAAGRYPPDRGYGFEVSYENPELLKETNADDGRWHMRVRGDRLLALRAGAAKKYWAGEFTLPLTLRTSPDIAPPRAWWTED